MRGSCTDRCFYAPFPRSRSGPFNMKGFLNSFAHAKKTLARQICTVVARCKPHSLKCFLCTNIDLTVIPMFEDMSEKL